MSQISIQSTLRHLYYSYSHFRKKVKLYFQLNFFPKNHDILLIQTIFFAYFVLLFCLFFRNFEICMYNGKKRKKSYRKFISMNKIYLHKGHKIHIRDFGLKMILYYACIHFLNIKSGKY